MHGLWPAGGGRSYDGLDLDELIEQCGNHTGCAYSIKPEHYISRCRACHRRHDAKSGERHHNAKVTDAQRRGIELSILQPDPNVPAVTQRELAEHFGVSEALISRIRMQDQRATK